MILRSLPIVATPYRRTQETVQKQDGTVCLSSNGFTWEATNLGRHDQRLFTITQNQRVRGKVGRGISTLGKRRHMKKKKGTESWKKKIHKEKESDTITE